MRGALAWLNPAMWAQNTVARPDYQASVAALRSEILYEMKDKHLPALSIALIDDGKLVWSEGFGFEDHAHQRPATARTIYRVGSVSKLFTDLGIMQRVERGQLHLDEPITQVLPDFRPVNPFGGDITLRELMSHKSGLTREPPVGHYFDSKSPSLKATVESLNQTTLVFAPQTHFKYSNAGVAVVGYVLERVAGEPFEDAVMHSVLEPLGMNDSAFSPQKHFEAHLAEGRMWSYDGLDFPAPTFQLGEGPAASMYTSVDDLSRFLTMVTQNGSLDGKQIISQESLHEMLTPQFGGDYGLGFAVDSLDGHKMFGHGGEVYGFTTQLSFLPNEKLGVVVATSMDDVSAATEHLADDALRFLLAKKLKTAPPAPVERSLPTPEEARAAAGTYKGAESNIILQEQSGHLTLTRSTGGNLTELKNKGQDFITDSRLSWWSMGVALHGDSLIARGQSYARIPDKVPAEAPEWTSYIGEYGWDYDKLFVLEEGGKLHILVEWFDSEPLEQTSKDTFILPDKGFYQEEQVRFERDDQGRIPAVWIGSVRFPSLPLGPRSASTATLSGPSPSKLWSHMRSKPLSILAEAADDPVSLYLKRLDPSIHFDVRSSSLLGRTGNAPNLGSATPLQTPVAEALVKASTRLRQRGYGLVLLKADRLATGDSRFSGRNAVDLTLYELTTGRPVAMTSGYGEAAERARAFYPGGTERQRWFRDALRYSMEAEGFKASDSQWWHFEYKQ
jgi:CubicO group peptidase (beta-lactamase class C family)/D-alanyl-D-alanine dipeptidase